MNELILPVLALTVGIILLYLWFKSKNEFKNSITLVNYRLIIFGVLGILLGTYFIIHYVIYGEL